MRSEEEIKAMIQVKKEEKEEISYNKYYSGGPMEMLLARDIRILEWVLS